MSLQNPLDPLSTLGPVIRTADRMRLDGCVNALTQEGMCLSLRCTQEALLDHYVRLLLTRLREDPVGHDVEVYFPANTDSLLNRFNAALSDKSLQSATQSSQSGLPVRVWVVHDAQKISEAELQLLARLIHNFPGSRIRALLLFHGSISEQPALEAFGRKLLRWDIELPTPEQAELALDMALSEGRQSQMSQLLRRIGCLPDPTALSLGLEAQQERDSQVAPQKSEPINVSWRSGALSRFSNWRDTLKDAWTGLRQFRPVSTSSSNSPALKKLAWASGGALLLSFLLMAWVQPQAFVGRKPSAPSGVAPTSAEPAPGTEIPAKPEPALDKREQKQGTVGVLRASLIQKS